jgi:hypothetical protein
MRIPHDEYDSIRFDSVALGCMVSGLSHLVDPYRILPVWCTVIDVVWKISFQVKTGTFLIFALNTAKLTHDQDDTIMSANPWID